MKSKKLPIIIGLIAIAGCRTTNNDSSSKNLEKQSNQQIEASLKKIKTNLKGFMNAPILKGKRKGNFIEAKATEIQFFTKKEVDSKDFVLMKDCWRAMYVFKTVKKGDCKPGKWSKLEGKAPYQVNDQAWYLTDNGLPLGPRERPADPIQNLEKIDSDPNIKMRLTLESMETPHETDTSLHSGVVEGSNWITGELKKKNQPWSDDYWALFRGVLGHRYADYRPQNDWKYNYDRAMADSHACKFIKSGDIGVLSPSEKYDLLTGNADCNDKENSFPLTNQMWQQGKDYWTPENPVETWMGICHGWAPAAYMLPRPANIITMVSPDGIKIPFYPSDIKSLGTLLWAQTQSPTRFIGVRCNVKNPETDKKTGRILDLNQYNQPQDCFDNNPATWHMSIVNQIGYSGRSFVLDATYDYEVWNQPVTAYRYTYFNPKDSDNAVSREDATIDFKKAKKWDKFYKFRGRKKHLKKIDKLVGVIMDVDYIVETSPNQNKQDHHSKDAIQTARYFYDLELDDKGRIIGGEWYSNNHPDFLWTPTKGAITGQEIENLFIVDWKTGEGDAATPIPSSWRSANRNKTFALGRRGIPAPPVVHKLFELAK